MRDFRRPLIVLTPKSLLRHPEAISQLADLKKGRFEVVLPDHDNVKPAKVEELFSAMVKFIMI